MERIVSLGEVAKALGRFDYDVSAGMALAVAGKVTLVRHAGVQQDTSGQEQN